MKKIALVAFALYMATLLSPAVALAKDDAEETRPQEEAWVEMDERVSETTHEVSVGETKVRYKATAGTLTLRDYEGAKKASVFYISYVREGVKDRSGRPITFSFNGGPGSSSVWLHLGLLGPKRVLLEKDGTAPPPPNRLVDNDYSLLDVTDMVFIDPVSTGYSRPAPDEKKEQFHGIDEDVQWVGEFIRLFTTRAERWNSPKFIIGESYGTTRAAGLSGYLQDRHGMFINGIMLVSSILNFQTADFDTGNDLPYILFLPTYTATAWYHGKLGEDYKDDLRAALDEAEKFAVGEYASVLMLGDSAPAERRAKTVNRLAELTGLTPEYIEQTNMRVHIRRFCKQLQRDRRLTTGRLDSRFTGVDRDAAGASPEYDPSYQNIYGAYSATMNDYVRRDLKFETDIPYEIISGRVRPWNYGRFRNRYVDVGETLRSAMTKNPALKVYVASGFYDLATPYFATIYTFDHLGLPEHLKNNVTFGFFEAGHMMYIDMPSLERLHKDLRDFIEETR